jgi:hypothetical protein
MSVMLFMASFLGLHFFADVLSQTIFDRSVWILIGISAILNIGVIVYHFYIPPHPKFLLVPWRNINIRVHLFSGIIELISGFIACFFISKEAAIVQAVAAVFFHVPSALLQTPIVFGSKAIMVPAYLLCICIHVFCGIQLLLNPESQYWMISTFLIFNIYAWCRFYYYAFDTLKLFQHSRYSVSILAAGLTIIPTLFGPLATLLLSLFVGLYIILYKKLVITNQSEYIEFVHERARDSIMQIDLSRLQFPEAESPRDRAYFVFQLLDQKKDGYLDNIEITPLLMEWGLPGNESDRYIKRFTSGGGRINFEDFYIKLKPLWKFIYFDILSTLDKKLQSEMIGRSLAGIKSDQKVEILAKKIKTDLLLKVPFLKNAKEQLIGDLASSLVNLEIKKGSEVFKEGDIGDKFFILEKGRVSIIKNKEYITDLNEGSFFGEAALLSLEPRNATVKVIEDSYLFSLSKTSFDHITTKYPDIRNQILEVDKSRHQ